MYLSENFMHVDENNLYRYAGEKNLQRTFVFPKNKSVRYWLYYKIRFWIIETEFTSHEFLYEIRQHIF